VNEGQRVCHFAGVLRTRKMLQTAALIIVQ